jgi:hypothetical protein
LDATEEAEEHIDAEDPSNGAFIVLLQLMFAQILLKNPDSVPVVRLVAAYFCNIRMLLTSSRSP